MAGRSDIRLIDVPMRAVRCACLGLLLSLAACTHAAPGLAEMAATWRSTAPVDDSYDMRCNDARMRIAEPLAEVLKRGLSRDQLIKLLGEPDLQPHSDVEQFGKGNLRYSLGLCHGDYGSVIGEYPSFVISFRDGRSHDAMVTWS